MIAKKLKSKSENVVADEILRIKQYVNERPIVTFMPDALSCQISKASECDVNKKMICQSCNYLVCEKCIARCTNPDECSFCRTSFYEIGEPVCIDKFLNRGLTSFIQSEPSQAAGADQLTDVIRAEIAQGTFQDETATSLLQTMMRGP